MGTFHPSVLGFLSRFLVLSAPAARSNLDMCYHAVASMHEDRKASEARTEKEAKDASSTIYVGSSAVASSSLLLNFRSFIKR